MKICKLRWALSEFNETRNFFIKKKTVLLNREKLIYASENPPSGNFANELRIDNSVAKRLIVNKTNKNNGSKA